MFNRYLQKISRVSNYSINRESYLRMDANERIIPFKKDQLNKLKTFISSSLLQSYPSTKKNLLSLIEKKENIKKDYINLIPGADAGIKYIFDIYSGQKGELISIYPTYGMVEVYCKTHKFKIKKVYENKFEDLIYKKIINKKTLFIYLANPNSPSGKLLDKNIILQIIKIANMNNKVVVIDEAYIEFSNQKSFVKMVKRFKNLIILKTFSKSIGLAGLRIGYMISNPKIINAINSIRPPHDISYFSVKTAEFFLKEKKIWASYLREIKKSKRLVNKQCEKRNLRFANTEANFFHIFFDKKKILYLLKSFKKKKILVASRHLGNFKAYPNSLRITYGSTRQMTLFFNTLDKILMKGDLR